MSLKSFIATIKLQGYGPIEQIKSRLTECIHTHPVASLRTDSIDVVDVTPAEDVHRPTEGRTFGRHIIIDAWFCNADGSVNTEAATRLNDPALLAQALDELVHLVGMQILKPAEMVAVPLTPELVSTGEDCGGVTGVVILTTSHGSIHTWPLQGEVSFDLFSCKDFDADKVLDFLAERFLLSGGVVRNFTRHHNPDYKQKFVVANSSQRF